MNKINSKFKLNHLGRVLSLKDGIVRIKGLDAVKSNELLLFSSGVYGLALNIEQYSVGAIIFGDERLIVAKDYVFMTRRLPEINASLNLLGRIVDGLGHPIDGKGKIEGYKNKSWSVLIERKAPGIIKRERVRQALETGIKVIDSLVPIGRGQRELILGDRQTGKTSLALDAIIHQYQSFKENLKNKKEKIDMVLSVYVAIGQRLSTVARVADILEKKGCLKFTTIVSATAADPMGLQYLAPYTGCAIAEYFMYQGVDTLIVYDDLSKHAAIYRQISLLLGRAPGREAYPGDVFYLHSRLLERSAKLAEPGGSLTALPIVETVEGDVSAYIPTNVISITDGQIYLDSTYFSKGIRPAINPGLSVSRVGSAAQNKIMKRIAGSLKLELAQFREVEEFTKFGSSLDEATLSLLARGERLVTLLIQPNLAPISIEKQILVILAGVSGLLDNVELSKLRDWEESLFNFVDKTKIFDDGFWFDKDKFDLNVLIAFLDSFTEAFFIAEDEIVEESDDGEF